MVTFVPKSGVNSIFVVDEVVAKDKFMRDFYTKVQAVGRDKKTIVITPEKAKFYWDEYQFKEYNCILIAKTVSVIYDLVKTRSPHEGVKHRRYCTEESRKRFIENESKSVYLNKEDAEKLKELHEVYGVEDIYFQATPSAQKLV